MDRFLKQLEAFLRALSVRQRVLLVGSAVLVLGVVALFVRLTQTADFKPLYSGLAPPDAQSVIQSLAVKSIPYQLSTDGTAVSVPADQVDKARLALATEGMPQTGRLGFELFDKPNWAGSDFSEQVNYQRALEGELERTIQTLGNVQSVRVHLVLPHDSLFTDRERAAKAAVVLKVRGGGLTDDETNAVTHLVASAVENLSPDDVTLIGADGRTPLVAKGRDGTKSAEQPMELEAALAEKLVATLTPIVGADHVKASVTVSYDQSSGDTTQELYDPANPVLVSTQIQEENFGGMPPAGVPGTPSNVPTGANTQKPAATPNATNPAAGAAQNAAGANPLISVSTESEGQHSETRTYAVSKTLKHMIDPAGKIQKVAAAVLVDDVVENQKDSKGQAHETRRKRTPDEMKQIEDVARAAMGFDAGRGDVLAVQNISFLASPYEGPAPPSIVEKVRLITEQWIWLMRYLALLGIFAAIYLFVLKPVKEQLVASFQNAGAVPALAATNGMSLQGSGGAALPGLSSKGFDEFELERALSQTNSEVERVIQLKKHLADRVRNEPIAAGQVIRDWMNEGKS